MSRGPTPSIVEEKHMNGLEIAMTVIAVAALAIAITALVRVIRGRR